MEPQAYYQQIKQDLEIIDVLCSPGDIAAVYRKAAEEMEQIRDYEDAASLAGEYRRKALQAEEQGKEELYRQACCRMDKAQSAAERKLAIDMFRQIGGYKDTDERAKECERQNIREMRIHDLKGFLLAAAVIAAAIAVFYLR